MAQSVDLKTRVIGPDTAVPETGEAPVRGVFVAGDCRGKRVRQLTTAVSDGANAALAACRYLDGEE